MQWCEHFNVSRVFSAYLESCKHYGTLVRWSVGRLTVTYIIWCVKSWIWLKLKVKLGNLKCMGIMQDNHPYILSTTVLSDMEKFRVQTPKWARQLKSIYSIRNWGVIPHNADKKTIEWHEVVDSTNQYQVFQGSKTFIHATHDMISIPVRRKYSVLTHCCT